MARQKYLVDTNVIIEANRGNTWCRNFLRSKHHDIFVAKISVKELFQKKGLSNREKIILRNFLHEINIIAPDNQILTYFTLLKFDFIKHNLAKEKADRIIAATALAKKLPLATFNIKHFSFIKGLKLISLKR